VDVTDAFASAARSYCGLIEAHATAGATEFLAACEEALAALHTAALSLSAADPGTDEPLPDRLDHEDWEALFHSLEGLIGDWDVYRRVFDPYDTDEPVTAQLSDDLADIYRDVRRGLDAFDRGSKADAAWDWRFSYTSHWGRHLAGALAPLNQLRSSGALG
jgi:hypothetical protein